MGQCRVGPGFRPRLYQNKYPGFLQVNMVWTQGNNPGRVYLHRCMTHDQPAFNPGRYPGWIAGSADLGYFFETHLHRGWTQVGPEITQDILSV